MNDIVTKTERRAIDKKWVKESIHHLLKMWVTGLSHTFGHFPKKFFKKLKTNTKYKLWACTIKPSQQV